MSRFADILKEMETLHNKKSADYGKNEDPLANLRASQSFGISPWIGCMIRLNDKVARVSSLILKGKLSNESVEDSFRDIAVYAILALVLYEEERANGTNTGT